jgi:hypothetical protein
MLRALSSRVVSFKILYHVFEKTFAQIAFVEKKTCIQAIKRRRLSLMPQNFSAFSFSALDQSAKITPPTSSFLVISSHVKSERREKERWTSRTQEPARNPNSINTVAPTPRFPMRISSRSTIAKRLSASVSVPPRRPCDQPRHHSLNSELWRGAQSRGCQCQYCHL